MVLILLRAQCILLLGFLIPIEAFSLSLFEKIGRLRFGNEKQVTIKDGVVDLNQMSDDEYLAVNGDILFIPNRFIDPDTVSNKLYQKFLKSQELEKLVLNNKNTTTGLNKPSASQGTLLIKFMNNRHRLISLSPEIMYHSANIFIKEDKKSRLIAQLGDVTLPVEEQKMLMDVYCPIAQLDVSGNFYLVIHVSAPVVNGENLINYSSFFIGPQKTYLNSLALRLYLSRAISGTFLFMSIFYMFIYSFRRQDSSSLYLGFYTLSYFIMSWFYALNLGMLANQILDFFSVLNVSAVCSLHLYVLDKLKIRFTHKIIFRIKSAVYIMWLISIFGIVINSDVIKGLTFLTVFFGGSFLNIAMMYYGFREKMDGILFFCIGAGLSSIFSYPVIMNLVQNRNEENGYNVMVAGFCVAISLALINAKEFAITYRKSLLQGHSLKQKNKEISAFNENLERMVEDKTQEIRSLLDYIPQGVLSIIGDGYIAENYSAHLDEILEGNNFSGQSFHNAILSKCTMSADARDQCWNSIKAILGETEIGFLANNDKLPHQLYYKSHSGEKILKVTWNPYIDRFGNVEKILVTFLDITSEKALEVESEKQRLEISRIQQLIQVDAIKIAQFFSTSKLLLHENLDLVKKSGNNIDHSDLRNMFVNVHTVKGAARTIHLNELASFVHDIEEYYTYCLSSLEQAPDIERMTRDVKGCLELINIFEEINSKKLNRENSYTSIVLDRKLLEEHFYLISDISNKKLISNHRFHKKLSKNSHILSNILFESLGSILHEYKNKAKVIAKDLGKLEPRFDIDIDDVPITPQDRLILDNCMIHILRNILDHGIEQPEKRLALGKEAHGLITIKAKNENGILKIIISDDGQGLAIGKLRDIAHSKGKLNENSSLHDIAEMVFESGISTAHKVSDISGRGVGMNAVRNFVEKIGGKIEILIGDEIDKNGAYISFQFFILLPIEQESVSNVS